MGAIDDPAADAATLAFFLEHDSVYGQLGTSVVNSAPSPGADLTLCRCGIEQGFMTTVLDLARISRSTTADLRRMRAAPLWIIPTSTGATGALAQVLPQLEGRLQGLALRVPVPDGSEKPLVSSDIVATRPRASSRPSTR